MELYDLEYFLEATRHSRSGHAASQSAAMFRTILSAGSARSRYRKSSFTGFAFTSSRGWLRWL